MKLPQNNKPRNRVKVIIATLTLIVAVVAGYAVFAKTNNYWPFQSSVKSSASTQQESTENNPNDESHIDDQPATKKDQENANNQKQSTYDRQQAGKENSSNNDNTDSSSKMSVSVTITTIYQQENEVHVNGFVTGVVEDGGTCTLTLTDESGKKVSVSRSGHENATNTTCGQSSIKTSQLHTGKWTASLVYASSKASGTSSNNPSIEVK